MTRSATSVSRICPAAAVILCCLLSASAMAQVAGSYGHPDTTRLVITTAPDTGIVTFKVFAERNGARLDRQAVVKLVNLASNASSWTPTSEHSESVITDIPWGSYEAEVSAVGFLSWHQPITMVATRNILEFDVVLRRDPSAVNLDVSRAAMPPKARRDTQRAVASLKSGKLDDAQKHLDRAFESSPADPNLNFLLGYLYFQRKDLSRAVNYLTASTNANSRNPQAFSLLGLVGLEQKDYAAAKSALEQAVLGDPENWFPHNLLANAYLHEKDYEKARNEAQIAIAKGKTEASPAQLVLGEAMLNLGHSQEGIQALNTFLQQSPAHPIAGQVRSLIAEIEQQSAAPVEDQPQAKVRLAGVDPLLAVPDPKLSVKAWQPPGVDDVKVAVAPDVSCPSERVIDESGKRVEELVDQVARFAAVEDLFHQALDNYGNPVRTETRKFNYVATISEPEPGFLAVDEYRADKLTLVGYPGNIASTGFAGLALVFHPHMRDNFDMICEGLGDWHGQATWLVHFRQRDDRPNRMHSYKVGNQYHAVKLKGRAWITADKFQIVRIEAEMVEAMPEIQLLSEHQVVEYGAIPFEKKHTTLWLPKSAEIYFDFRRHRYYRRHSFDHYMLFSADAEEKTKEPKSNPTAKPEGPAGKTSSR
jgi:tetratricopeptide (TPR) repeat protein